MGLHLLQAEAILQQIGYPKFIANETLLMEYFDGVSGLAQYTWLMHILLFFTSNSVAFVTDSLYSSCARCLLFP